MDDLTLTRLRGCVANEGCTAAFLVLREAIHGGEIARREGSELMRVLEEGSPEMINAAIEALRAGERGREPVGKWRERRSLLGCNRK